MDEVELLKAYAREGSQEAFAQIVRKHIDWVYGMSVRLVRDAELAEDVTQAVFLVLARKAASLAGKRPISGWLFRTCRNCASNAFHKERVRARYEQKAAAMRSEIQSEPKSGAWEELTPVLDAGVAKLRRGDRDAVLLRFYEGRTIREVGEAMGTSEEAARKRVSRALDRLRNHFAAHNAVMGTDPSAALTTLLLAKAPPGLAAKTIGGSAGATAKSIAASVGWTTAAAAKAAAVLIAVVGVGSVIVAQVGGAASRSGGTAAVGSTRASSPIAVLATDEPTAEVIAVGRDPLGKNQWWLPDGTPLEQSPIVGEIPLLATSEPRPGANAFVILTREKAPSSLTWMRSSFGVAPPPQWTWAIPPVMVRTASGEQMAVVHLVRFDAPPREVKATVGLSKAARYPVAVFGAGETDGGTLEAEFEPPTQQHAQQAMMYITHNRLGAGEVMSVEVLTTDGQAREAPVIETKRAPDDRLRSGILIPGGKAEDVQRVRIMAVPMKLIELPGIALAPRRPDGPFFKRFASGGEVEVMCVGRDPKGKNEWWLPDGTPIKKYPFDGQITYDEKPGKAVARNNVLVVILRDRDVAAVSSSSSSHQFNPAPSAYLAHLTPNYSMRVGGKELENGPEPNVIGFETLPEKLGIKMRITGTWEFAAASVGTDAGRLGNVLFSKPVAEGKGVKFDVTFDAVDAKAWDFRIAAEMKNGKRVSGIAFAAEPVGNGKDRFEALFQDLKPANVKQFVVEMSRWDETEFSVETKPKDVPAVEWTPEPR